MASRYSDLYNVFILERHSPRKSNPLSGCATAPRSLTASAPVLNSFARGATAPASTPGGGRAATKSTALNRSATSSTALNRAVAGSATTWSVRSNRATFAGANGTTAAGCPTTSAPSVTARGFSTARIATTLARLTSPARSTGSHVSSARVHSAPTHDVTYLSSYSPPVGFRDGPCSELQESCESEEREALSSTMATLSLRISIAEKGVTKTMQFDPSTSVFDACRIIREKLPEANQGQPKDYGLFLADEDVKKGVWLEAGRSLEYYILRNGDLLEYRKKLRTLRVRLLDGSLKTMLVDDSQPVANLMVVICTKIGITNHDEYSLVRETVEEEQPERAGLGTLTLRRKKAQDDKEPRDAKMEQLRKKLKTDDEVNWIDPSKTLREQGVEETEAVLLRRKFFFSDQNIDGRDPVQLNLLYVQARDAILDGTHPVTLDKACEFAGIQCQVQFGDYSEAKHRPGFYDLKELLPASYAKVKAVEKKIFAEHRKHMGLSELDAKVLYTKTARDLPTYGVTFFLVKEKMKGKNKLVPRLLGVTKDSVLRLDEKTKEILKTWPLTTVRRWGASPNTFTLDFGDYSDQYYSVQTTEAEQILQLIAGYIDIILKKKKSKDHFGIEGDEGSTMVEDSVSPLKATFLQHNETSKVGKVNTESVAKRAIMRAADGERSYGIGHMQGAQHTTVGGQANLAHAPPTQLQQSRVTSVLSEPQRALLSTISSGREVITTVETELQTKAQLPEIGSDPASLKWKETTLDTNKQNVSSQIAAMNAATAQVVTLTSGPVEEVDHTAVGAAITTITSNLPEMTRGVRMIAALMDDDNQGDKLLDAARKLCTAFSDLLKAAEPETKEPRQNLLNAASRVGEASQAVLGSLGDEEDATQRGLQDALLSQAKAVATATAALVLKAKSIAGTCSDQTTQNKVIGAATQCALATSQLVACAKVVAPTLHSPACQEQLVAAVKEVARAVEGLVSVCNESCQDERLLRELSGAAAEVSRTLNDLLNHIKLSSQERAKETVQESSVETILVATDRLFASTGDAAEMVRQARVLGQATAHLIQSIKGEAERQPDSEIQRRLLAAAKTLADATARMVEAARLCASSPHDMQYQNQLRVAAEELRQATVAAGTPALRRNIFSRLESAAKQAAAAGTQCVAAAQGAAPHTGHRAAQEELLAECRSLAEQVPALVEGVKGTLAQPDSGSAQLHLVDASEAFLVPGSRVVQAARAVLPTVSDQSSAMQLQTSTHSLAQSLSDLRVALSRAREACGSGLELDAAADLIRSLRSELEAFQRAADRLELRPLPGETAELTSLQLGSVTKSVSAGMAQLVSAASQANENYTGLAARNTASSLRELTHAVRGVAATTSDRDTQRRLITNADLVMEHSLRLVEQARTSLQHPDRPDGNVQLATVVKDVSQALNSCVSCLPGQKAVDEALHSIADASSAIDSHNFPHTDKSYGQLQQELNSAAASLNDASAEVVSSIRSPVELAASSRKFGSAFGSLVGVSMEMAGQTVDKEVRGQMVVSLKNVSMVSSTLLVTAKTVAADPTAPNAKNQLAAAARGVTDSINHLIDVCTSAAPGQKECDNAIRNIQSMRPLLDNPVEPVSDLSYFECLDHIMEKSKSLGDGMTGIAQHAKASEHERFGGAVHNAASAVCGLVEAAAQAAYLVGVSHPASQVGRAGLVDQAQFARAAQAIRQACQQLTNPAANQQQVLSAATVIAKHTSSLCNACRGASSKTTNPVAKRHFVQSAKDVANSTASLVKEIKALDADYSEQNRLACGAATRPLLEAVDGLCTFAASPEFASQPARIANAARAAQEPITNAGRDIIDGAVSLVRAAKSLAVNPKDPPTWQLLATHSKSVSDAIKRLASSIRDKAPGQRECDDAAQRLRAIIRDLDAACLSAVSQSLAPRRDSSLQGFAEQTEAAAAEMADKLEPLRQAATGGFAEALGHAIDQATLYLDPLVTGAIGAASNMVHSKQQMALLDQAKTVAECSLQLVLATKEAGGNPKAVQAHQEVEEAVEATRDSLADLGRTLEALATQAGIVRGVLDQITRSMARVADSRASMHAGDMSSEQSFVEYQTRMVQAAKEIARIAQDMTTKSGSGEAARLGPLAAELARKYAQLAQDSVGAAAATANSEVAYRLRTGVQELGRASQDLVRAGGACQLAPTDDEYARRDVADSARIVSEKVSQILAALQAGSRGTQACINAASTVSGIIGDLDTTIMFATAGTLHAETEDESFADHRENILKTAKALVEDTKTLVAGAASSQEQLAVAAQNAVSTILQLAEVVKLGAASLGAHNPEAQVMLINAVKDVASALGDLVHATKAASGKSINDPSMNHLKESAKVMVTNVTSLLKTVKAVEDEHTRGTRALEATIEAIGQEMRAMHTPETPSSSGGSAPGTSPEDLVRCTKAITVATAKAVAAGSSGRQEDVIVAANMGRKAISDMLHICKGAAAHAENAELRSRTLTAGHEVAVRYRELLQSVMLVISRPAAAAEARQGLPPASRRIAQAVTELVAVAELLKGSDWVDPDDPTVIAENELLGAAASIDAAAKKLASLRPRRSVQEADESLNFDEMILEAAKSIAAANSALVKAASAAQRELIEAGKVSRRPLHSSDDGQWSEGLISAARLVAAATHSLVEAANALVQGAAGEEKLISSAKQVASSTAQLLVACKVKADPDAESTKRLQAAGNAVKRATDNLVRAAQQAIHQVEERSLVLNRRMVGGIAQEINARSEVLRIEKQLEEARSRLTAIRQAKYRLKGGTGDETSPSDPETDGYGSGYESFTTRYETRSFDQSNPLLSSPSHAAPSSHGVPPPPPPPSHVTPPPLFNSTTSYNSTSSFNGIPPSPISSPEKLYSSLSKVEQAYSSIRGMLDETDNRRDDPKDPDSTTIIFRRSNGVADGFAGETIPTRTFSTSLKSPVNLPSTFDSSQSTTQTFTTNNFESSVNNYMSQSSDQSDATSTSLEQRMLKQSLTQHTTEKRVVTMTTQMKSFKIDDK